MEKLVARVFHPSSFTDVSSQPAGAVQPNFDFASVAAPASHPHTGAPFTSDTARISSLRQRFSRLALLFVDSLERHIYNGYEGSINLTPISNPSTLSFFRSNKKSCCDWFTKVRPRLLQASATAASSYDTIRFDVNIRLQSLVLFVIILTDTWVNCTYLDMASIGWRS